MKRLGLLLILAAAAIALPVSRSNEAAVPPARQADRKKLDDKTLKDYGKDCLRSGCHAKVKESAWTHGPVAIGACEACHEPEGTEEGTHAFRYPREREKLCTFCHNLSPTGAVVHKPYADSDCGACHDPHGGKTQALLPEVQVSALCDRCHDREIVLASGKKLANVKKEIAAGKFKHGPVEKGDCVACHLSHSSDHAGLLSGGFVSSFYSEFSEAAYDFCFTCHDSRLVLEERTTSTGFRDGDRNLHHVHVNRKKGRTCSVCHDIHAGNGVKLVKARASFGPGGWQLPIDFVKTDTGGTCSSGCHKKLSYDSSRPPAPVPGTPSRRKD